MAQRAPLIAGQPFKTRSTNSYAVLRNAVGTTPEADMEVAKPDKESSGSSNSLFHLILSGVHVAVTVLAIAISLAGLIFAMGGFCTGGSCKPKIYLTNTFAKASKIGSNTGWAVATERGVAGGAVQYPNDRDAFVFTHYYECMATARMADGNCPTSDDLPKYISCLRNTSSDVLTVCNTISSSFSRPWATPEEYMDCLFSFPKMHNSVNLRASKNVFRSCLARTMWPFFEVQQGTDSPYTLGAFNWMVFMALGLWILTSFAVYSISPFEAGGVENNEPEFFKRLGWLWSLVSLLWNAAFFLLLHLLFFRDTTTFERGDDSVPMSNSTFLFSFVGLGAAMFYFLAEINENRTTKLVAHVYDRVFRGRDKDVVVKHGHITRMSHRKKKDESDEDGEEKDAESDQMRLIGPPEEMRLGASLYNHGIKTFDITAMDAAQYYTPPLMRVWADGLLFADPFFFVGMAGATGHLAIDQTWLLFFAILIYRAMGSSIARFIYQCFMNNLSLSPEINAAYHSIKDNARLFLHEAHQVVDHHARKYAAHVMGKQHHKRVKTSEEKTDSGENMYSSTPHMNIAVMALSTQFSAIFLLSLIMFLIANVNSTLAPFSLFQASIWTCLFAPEILRLLWHVMLQASQPSYNEVPWNTLNFYFFAFEFDLLLRIIFACIVFSLKSDYPSPAPGTRQFLMDKSIALMDTYLDAFGVN